jgi:hypothetical protein
MKRDEVLAHAERYHQQMAQLAQGVRASGGLHSSIRAHGSKAEVCEFLSRYAGPRSAFFREASNLRGIDEYQFEGLASILASFIAFIKAGLAEGISPERQAQLDVVSDFLDIAHRLLEDKLTHPAAAAMLVGATLEEFLRTWLVGTSLALGNRNPSLQSYADTLRSAGLITVQDVKDITSWAGIRNHAAHGEWEEVSDRQRIKLMLEGVNLFMRRCGG